MSRGAPIPHMVDTDSPAPSPDPSSQLTQHQHGGIGGDNNNPNNGGNGDTDDTSSSTTTTSGTTWGSWARRNNKRVLDLVTGASRTVTENDDNDDNDTNLERGTRARPLHISSSLSMSTLGAVAAQNKRAKQTCCCFAVLFLLALGGVVALGIWVWKLKKEDSGVAPGPTPTPQPSNLDWLAKQVDSVRNSTIDPCDDFYQYACGGWISANTPIPDDVVRLSRSFTVIGDANLAVLKAVNDEDWPVIGPFYKSCMDTATIDTFGHSPINDDLKTIGKIGDRATVLYVAGDLLARQGVTSLFGVGVIVDSKNPSKNILDLSQGGLSLGIPDYYRDNATRDAYSDHMTRMFTLLGDAAPAAVATSILSFESKIAEFTLPLEELRDPERIYNKFNLSSIQALTDLHWISFFNGSRIPYDTLDANVQVPNFMVKLTQLVEATPIADLQNYLKWRVLTTASPKLSASFANETFRFFSGVLSGQKVQQARWKTCTSYTDSLLGDILGRYFVQRAFNGQSLNITQKLIKLIEVAFGTRLPDIDWMDDETRAAARVKLSQVVDLVGYPAKWADYSSVAISGRKFYENTYNLQQFGWAGFVKVLTGPVDKTRWQMTPPTVNAYYDPSYNTINFPAGIIQPTFFSAQYPMAMNFGGIGMVMGHELTHGFDDQGRQYDGTGLLHPWWTKQSIEHFTERATCLVNQYSQFKIGEDHVNGNLTLGENIADNGGIRIAFNAYKQWIKDNGEEPTLPTKPALTNDQLYFLAFAQGWCTITRDAAAKQRLKTDVHSPPFARVLGPLRNFDEFAKAYNCPAGSPMNPKDKCLMW